MIKFKRENLHEIEKKNKAVKKKHSIMIVDDEETNINSMRSLLSEEYNVVTANSGREALSYIKQMKRPDTISLIISDQRMPYLTGIELFEEVKDIIPNTIRIIVTAFHEKDDVIDSINKGKVYEYILKPFEPEGLKLRVKRAIEAFENQKELEEYRQNLEIELTNTQEQLIQNEIITSRLRDSLFAETLNHPEHFVPIITDSKEMLDIFKYIEAIAEFNVPVLITGETGTGKELIAQAIHNIYINVNEKEGKFVADNVAGWNETLFSDTLFGHEKGAFTDARTKRQGLLERAKNGTLFLDEIGDLDIPLQTILLRLIQEKQYHPLGSDIPQTTNARLVFATNRDINEMKEKGEFRKDLFFRLNTHHIHLPPLKERKSDIPLLVELFIKEASKEYNREIPSMHDKLISLLSNYHFPGNVRELRSMVFEAVSLHKAGELSIDVFIYKIREQGGKMDFSSSQTIGSPTGEDESGIIITGSFPSFEEMVNIYTKEAMKRAGNKQTAAAKLAELPRTTFVRYWKGQL